MLNPLDIYHGALAREQQRQIQAQQADESLQRTANQTGLAQFGMLKDIVALKNQQEQLAAMRGALSSDGDLEHVGQAMLASGNPHGLALISEQRRARAEQFSEGNRNRRAGLMAQIEARKASAEERRLANEDLRLTREKSPKAGEYKLPDGSRINHSQIMSEYRLEHKLVDPLDLAILEKTDPVRAAKERDKISNAMPFPAWAKSKFGVDVRGGATATAPPQQTATQLSPYKTPDDVKAQVKAGKLPRDQAVKILKEQFGYAD